MADNLSPTDVTTELTAAFSEAVLDNLLQGTNGSEVYSNARAMYGYLDAQYNLQIPEDLVPVIYKMHKDKTAPNVSLTELGKVNGIYEFTGSKGKEYVEKTKFVYLEDRLATFKLSVLNYLALTTASKHLKPETAMLAANMRARWVVQGCLYSNSDKEIIDPAKAFPEITVVKRNPAGSLSEKIAAAANVNAVFALLGDVGEKFKKLYTDVNFGWKKAVQMSEAVWNTTEYLFRTRGHHYKPEYDTLIKKTISANFEGTNRLPDGLELNHIFHTAIHPFGVRMLPVMAAHFVAHNTIGNALIIRMGGAPNGLAAITTSRAVIDVVSTEPWYPNFRNSYGGQIETCIALANVIMDDKYSFSLAAELYGLERKTIIKVGDRDYTVEEGKAAVVAVSVVGQGVINALQIQKKTGVITGFSFENAKALEKQAYANPTLAAKVVLVLNLSLELIDKAKTLDEAARMAFPAIEAESVS